MISVIIPVRNGEKTIRRAIESVFLQDVKELEVICILNGCTDKTYEQILSIGDDRIKVIESSPGIVPALNAGIRVSKGDLIARQDCDDVWLPGKLKAQIDHLNNNPNIDVLGTQMEIVDGLGNHIRNTSYPTEPEKIAKSLLNSENPIGHPSVVFRSRILDKCAGYFDLFPMAEDMDLWTRCLAWFKISNLEKVYVRYTHVQNPKYDPRSPIALSAWYRMLYGVS